jgi:hypothetical protein
MRNAAAGIFLTWCLAAASGASAQDENSPETQASIRKGEAAHLDRDSIGDYSSMKRFEVDIAWGDDAGPRPGDHKNRRVRYVADCRADTLTLVTVAVFDRTGMLEKSMIVPPRASDPFKPDAGSIQAKWLQNVCRQ